MIFLRPRRPRRHAGAFTTSVDERTPVQFFISYEVFCRRLKVIWTHPAEVCFVLEPERTGFIVELRTTFSSIFLLFLVNG